jgi:hypothetical protein
MSSQRKNRAASFLMIFLVALSSTLLPMNPAVAKKPGPAPDQSVSVPVDSSRMKLGNTPKLVISKLAKAKPEELRIEATSKVNYFQYLRASNLFADITIGSETKTYGLGDVGFEFDDSSSLVKYTLLLETWMQPLDTIGDMSTISKIAIRGTTDVNSFANDSIKKSLGTQGLDFGDQGGGVYIEGSPTQGTRVWVSGMNNTDKDVYLAVSNPKFAGVALTSNAKFIYAPAKGYFYWPVGSSSQDLTLNRVAKDLTAVFAVASESAVDTSRVSLPAGLELAIGHPSKDWQFDQFSVYMNPEDVDRTKPCLLLKNTSAKALNVSANLTWTFDGVSFSDRGNSVNKIAPGYFACLKGTFENFAGPKGDFRFASAVSVSGKILPAPAPAVDTSAVVLPKGLAFDGTQTVVKYDANTKKSWIHVALTVPEGYGREVKFAQGKVNGVVAESQVGHGDMGGDWLHPIDPRARFKIGPLNGDYRTSTKPLVVTGKVSGTIPTSVYWWSESPDHSIYCNSDMPQSYPYNATSNSTTIKFSCNNISLKEYVIDLSGVSFVWTSKAGKISNLNADPATTTGIVMKPKSGAILVTMVEIPSDIRTDGGKVEVFGNLKVTN